MLTLAYLIVETWKVFWRPRATVARKSSFRTLQRGAERPALPNRQPQQKQQQQQQEQSESQHSNKNQQHHHHHHQQQQQASSSSTSSSSYSWNNKDNSNTNFPASSSSCSPSSSSCSSPFNSPKTSPRLPRQQQQQHQQQQQQQQLPVARGIPVATSKQIVPSVSKPTQLGIQSQTASTTHASPPSTSPKPQPQQQQPSHIPGPVQKSVKTLVLEPSVSGNRMDENWATKQMEKFSFGFDEADKDKSGSLSFDEVYAVLQSNGFKGSKTEAQFIFGQMDADDSKAVSRDEFNLSMKKTPRMSIREYVYRKAFLQMDKDKSGYLTKTEIADATKNEGGIDIGSKLIADLLVYITKEDDNEKVDYEEFLRVLGLETTATVFYKIFKAMDKDGSGFLTRNEMMDAVSNEFELKLSAPKISQLLIDLVKDDDKKMNYDEFVQSWLKQQKEQKKSK